MNERIIIDMLTEVSVSVVTKKYVEVDGIEMDVGEPHRKAYANSTQGRIEVEKELPSPQVAAIFSIWGDEPTVFPEEHILLPEETAQ